MTADRVCQPTVLRTERGLSIAGTRITLYAIMDYVAAGWPPQLIRDRFNLTDQQIDAVMTYIAAHRAEVETEYQQVREQAAANRRYWEARNRDRFARIAALPPTPEKTALRAKLASHKAKLHHS